MMQVGEIQPTQRSLPLTGNHRLLVSDAGGVLWMCVLLSCVSVSSYGRV